MISLIMPLWNVTQDLAEMTQHHTRRIREVHDLPYEIIVVDNGSPYRTQYDADLITIWPENRGIAKAWNHGWSLATGDVLIFLNNDVWVEPRWDHALADAAVDGKRIAFPYTDHGDGLDYRESDGGVAGWCFAVSGKTANEIGPFDEQFTPAFYEDTDWFHRAWMRGMELTPVPEAHVKHQRRTSAQFLPHMPEMFVRHRLLYSQKYNLNPHFAPPFYDRVIRPYTRLGS